MPAYSRSRTATRAPLVSAVSLSHPKSACRGGPGFTPPNTPRPKGELGFELGLLVQGALGDCECRGARATGGSPCDVILKVRDELQLLHLARHVETA